jgi:hypothetical protein
MRCASPIAGLILAAPDCNGYRARTSHGPANLDIHHPIRALFAQWRLDLPLPDPIRSALGNSAVDLSDARYGSSGLD